MKRPTISTTTSGAVACCGHCGAISSSTAALRAGWSARSRPPSGPRKGRAALRRGRRGAWPRPSGHLPYLTTGSRNPVPLDWPRRKNRPTAGKLGDNRLLARRKSLYIKYLHDNDRLGWRELHSADDEFHGVGSLLDWLSLLKFKTINVFRIFEHADCHACATRFVAVTPPVLSRPITNERAGCPWQPARPRMRLSANTCQTIT